MSSDNTALTASEFPVALFSLALPVMLAAFNISGITAPHNMADIMITGLAVLGLLCEPFKGDRHSTAPLWFKAGLPGLLIVWISYNSFARLTMPLSDALPFLMEARPILYLLAVLLWLTMFGPPEPKQISFWASCLSLLVCTEFGYTFFLQGLPGEPYLFGHYSLTGPVLLAGLCATLHNASEHKLSRLIILAGIFCSLSRDISFAAVVVMIMFGPKGPLKKISLIAALLLFNYVALAPQGTALLNPNDLPAYWTWFSILELLANNPVLLLTGFPLTVPLPLSVPASLWTIWHEQQFVWTDLGIYLFHITPFWLHLLTAWGLGGICLAAATATALLRRFPSDMMCALIAGTTIAGLFSPLFYSPASAIVLMTTFCCATLPEVQSFRFE